MFLCVQDGCDFVCRSRPRRHVEYVSRLCVFVNLYKLMCDLHVQKEPTFGADTDEEDEEKDDNLLPM